jgi:hypothetical protein
MPFVPAPRFQEEEDQLLRLGKTVNFAQVERKVGGN